MEGNFFLFSCLVGAVLATLSFNLFEEIMWDVESPRLVSVKLSPSLGAYTIHNLFGHLDLTMNWVGSRAE